MTKQDDLFDEQKLDEFLRDAIQYRLDEFLRAAMQYRISYGVPFGGYQDKQQPLCKCGLNYPHTKDMCQKPPPKVKQRKERETVSVRMPFGKHKGTPLVNLPTDYLDWVLGWMDSEESGWMSYSRKRLFDELDAEYERRKTGVRPTRAMKTALSVSPEAKALLPEFIKSGYRAMALKVHPDKGGTPEQMIALKQLKEALEKL